MSSDQQIERRQYVKPLVRVVEFHVEERLMGCNKLPFAGCTTQKDS